MKLARLCESLAVGNYGHIWVKLEHGGRNLRGDWSKQDFLKDFGLLCAVDNQQNFLCLHDGLDAHGYGEFRHFVNAPEEAGIVLNRLRLKCDPVRRFVETFVRFVEADMAGGAEAQKLKVNPAERGDQSVISGTFGGDILRHAVRKMDVLRLYIDAAEEVLAHEIVVALFILRGEAAIFVEVHRFHFGEIDVALAVPVDKLTVNAERRGTGSEAEHTARIENNLRGDNVGRFAAHSGVV